MRGTCVGADHRLSVCPSSLRACCSCQGGLQYTLGRLKVAPPPSPPRPSPPCRKRYMESQTQCCLAWTGRRGSALGRQPPAATVGASSPTRARKGRPTRQTRHWSRESDVIRRRLLKVCSRTLPLAPGTLRWRQPRKARGGKDFGAGGTHNPTSVHAAAPGTVVGSLHETIDCVASGTGGQGRAGVGAAGCIALPGGFSVARPRAHHGPAAQGEGAAPEGRGAGPAVGGEIREACREGH